MSILVFRQVFDWESLGVNKQSPFSLTKRYVEAGNLKNKDPKTEGDTIR